MFNLLQITLAGLGRRAG